MFLGERAAAGYRLEEFAVLGSTNDAAMARLAQGDPGRLWIVSREQTRGRGRLGRDWLSPPGNLYASLALADPAPARCAAQLGFVAGVALVSALRQMDSGRARIKLKWPNDALCDGAKLSGLLLEGAALAGGGFGCVVGLGVNCLSSPSGLPYATASLKSLGAESMDRVALFAILSDCFAHWLDIWARGDNFTAIREAWLERALGLGSPARVRRENFAREGVFRGIDAEGRMLLETSGKVETIEAGDAVFGEAHTGGL